MDLRLLRYFVAVAEELSVTRAAARLGVTQPSLSLSIRQLEGLVDTPLFFRERRRFQLTEAGRLFLQEARGIIETLDRALAMARRAARAEAGQITIGLMPGVEGKVFARVVPVLIRHYPEVRIVLRTLSSPAQQAALESGEINVGFLRGPINDPELVAEIFAHERILAMLPAGHPLTEHQRIPLPLLTELPLIQFSRAYAPAVYDVMAATAEQAGVSFRTLFETEDLLTTLNAVGSGLGFSLLPEYAQEVMPKTVVARPIDLDPEPQVELLVAYRKDDRLPALAFFLSLLREFEVNGQAEGAQAKIAVFE